jgi:hypothetical protein
VERRRRRRSGSVEERQCTCGDEERQEINRRFREAGRKTSRKRLGLD